MREDASPHLIFFFQAFFQMDATFLQSSWQALNSEMVSAGPGVQPFEIWKR
jgi:hypothetical protein